MRLCKFAYPLRIIRQLEENIRNIREYTEYTGNNKKEIESIGHIRKMITTESL